MFRRNSVGMTSKIVLSMAWAGLVMSGGCSTRVQEIQSQWSTGPVTVDGQSGDWQNTSLKYLEESQVSLGLRNDAGNFYILFCFKNQTWARMIQAGGVTLWLDNTGSKKKEFGIRYAGGPTPSQMQSQGEGSFSSRFTSEQRERMLDRQSQRSTQVTIVDKKAESETPIPADGSQGPAVSFAYENGFYSYEFQIPLQKSETDRFGIDTQPGKTIELGLEWGGMGVRGQMMRERGAGTGGGGMPPQGPAEGMGRPPAGMEGRAGGPPRQPPAKQEMWVKILLASPPAN